MKLTANLIVVLDPNYADRIDRAAALAPVWVVESQTNRSACERRWRGHPHPDHRDKDAITLYKTPNPENRLESLREIIPQLETHHGEVKNNDLTLPSGFVLEVIGLAVTDQVTDMLRELGFASFVETPEGFQVCRQDGISTHNPTHKK
jgi:hypothetical protein